MHIISFDVGIRNLAFVVIDTDCSSNNAPHRITSWQVLDICGKGTKAKEASNTKIGTEMMTQLDAFFEEYDIPIDMVLIENQIGRNAIKMKSVQNMLVMYFVMRGFREEQIVNYNAVNKLKLFTVKGKKSTYAERKKASKHITEYLCNSCYDSETLNLYSSTKKKDDLADCLLQCLDYMHKVGILDNTFFNIPADILSKIA